MSRVAMGLAGILIFTAAEASAQRRAPQKLVVPQLVAERGVDEGLVKLLNEVLLHEFAAASRFDVIGGSDVQALLSHEEQQVLHGCREAACLAEIGGALGGKYLARASVGRVGKYILVNIKIMDVDTSTVLARTTVQAWGDDEDILEAVREGVYEVMAGARLNAALTAGEPELGARTWVAGGLAVAGLAAGLAFGAASRAAIDVSVVDPAYPAAQDQAVQRALLANMGYGVAGVAALVAIIFGWMDLDTATPTITPVAVPDGAGALIRF